MSELKAFEVTRKALFGRTCTEKVYLKSEADKVIAELKENLNTTKDLLNKALDCISNDKKHIMSLARKNNHANNKRCLAMAERCKYRMYYLSSVVDYESSKLFPNPTAIKRYTKKESRMDYWKNRWLKLAEQFKEGV